MKKKVNIVFVYLDKIRKKIYWKLIEPFFSYILFYFPINKNRIVLDNFGGKGFGGNPKFIAEALHKMNTELEMIWLVDNSKLYEFPDYIKPIKIDSILALYMRATSYVWIDNIRNRHPIRKKNKQIYLQTWHGSMSAKRVEKDAEKHLSKDYIKEAKYDGNIANAIIADNFLQEKIYVRAFWLGENVEILRVGFPQNDIKKNDDKMIESKIKKDLKLHSTDYCVLYAPTFRDDFSTKGYELDFEKVVKAFEKNTKKKAKIIIRLHPNVSFQKNLINFNDRILDGTDYPNIQELVNIADAVISDYSSTLFDFAMLNKPAFICALDYDDYKQKRGFIPEFNEFPFPVAKSSNELVRLINEFDFRSYKNRVRVFYEKYPIYGDGHASENVAFWILNKMNKA